MIDQKAPPETVLFVEDEVLIRMDMAEYLREAGYRVHEVHNATEAMDALNSKMAIDIVVSDIQMEGEIDGAALAQGFAQTAQVSPFCSVLPIQSPTTSRRASAISSSLTGRALLENVGGALKKPSADDG
jgi:CheY-like chemotaxis protein